MSLLIQRLSETVCRLTFDRPDCCNAFSSEMLRRVLEELESLRHDKSCRVVILSGSGRHFCGGLDFSEALQDASTAYRMTHQVTQLLATLRRTPLIVIAEVNGAARGGGAATAFAADLIVASEEASFAFPEVQRGLEPVLLFPLLRRRLPEPLLRRMILTGSKLTAGEAKTFGLVQECVPTDMLAQTAERWAEQICLGEPTAVRAAKIMLAAHENSLFAPDLTEELSASLEAHTSSWNTQAAREGVQAFLEKREPNWTGEE